MSREDILKEIIAIVDPLDEITEDTVIEDSDDLDSLALFNIVLYMKKNGFKGSLTSLSSCKTVSDIIDLVEKA